MKLYHIEKVGVCCREGDVFSLFQRTAEFEFLLTKIELFRIGEPIRFTYVMELKTSEKVRLIEVYSDPKEEAVILKEIPFHNYTNRIAICEDIFGLNAAVCPFLHLSKNGIREASKLKFKAVK